VSASRVRLRLWTARDLRGKNPVGEYLIPRVPQVGEGRLSPTLWTEDDMEDRSRRVGSPGQPADVNDRRVPHRTDSTDVDRVVDPGHDYFYSPSVTAVAFIRAPISASASPSVVSSIPLVAPDPFLSRSEWVSSCDTSPPVSLRLSSPAIARTVASPSVSRASVWTFGSSHRP
jgi:hypothetical protein